MSLAQQIAASVKGASGGLLKWQSITSPAPNATLMCEPGVALNGDLLFSAAQYSSNNTSSKIITSTDRGKTWSTVASSLSRNYYTTGCSDDGSVVYGGTGSAVIVSTDGGVTWAERSNTGATKMKVSKDGKVCICYRGSVIVSQDTGATFKTLTMPSNAGTIIDVHTNPSGSKIYIAFSPGTLTQSIYYSEDYGTTWKLYPNVPACQCSGFAVWGNNDENLILVGYMNIGGVNTRGYAITNNQGGSWIYTAFQSGATYQTAPIQWARDGSRMMSMTNNGNFESFDGGKSWKTYSITDKTLPSGKASFSPDGTFGFACSSLSLTSGGAYLNYIGTP